MSNLLAHALAVDQFWNVRPSFGHAAFVALRDADYEAHVAEYRALAAAPTPATGEVRPEDRPYKITRGVALIQIDGVMTRKPTSYGGTSTLLTQHAIRLAGRDQDVDAIMIVASSPGGSVNGLQELTDEIAAVGRVKPIDGFIPDGAFSAAYYVLTPVRRLTIAATAQCGSLGTMMVLVDSSKAAQDAGQEIEVISTGPLKGQGTPGTVPSDEYRKMLQDHAAAYGDFFWKAIESGRAGKVASRDAVFTGRYWMAADALALGLVDAIGSLDDAMAELVEANAAEDDADPDVVDARDPLEVATLAAAVLVGANALGDAMPAGAAEPVPLLPAAAAAKTISAPGGQARPAGNDTAPPKGAEKTTTGNTSMSFRQSLINTLGEMGLGRMVRALNGATSEDPGYLANVVGAEVKAEAETMAAGLVARNPLLASLRAMGVTDEPGLDALVARAQNGDEYLADLRKEAKVEVVRAMGPDDGAQMYGTIERAGLADARAIRDLNRKKADAKVGIKPDGSAPTRQSAATGAVGIDEAATAVRPFDRLTAAQQAPIAKQAKGDKAREDRMASELIAKLGEVAA